MQWKVACSVVLLGLLAESSFATPVFIDSVGRDWLDVNDSRFRSWDDMASVCDALTGACSGTLLANDPFTSDIDLTGYHWAARDEVRDLFYEIGGLPAGSLDSYAASFDSAIGHGAHAFDIFEPTIQFSSGPGVLNVLNGVTRDRFFDSNLMEWDAYSGIIASPPVGEDGFTLTTGLPINVREVSMGAFLYRELAVPEPGTLALFGIAIGAMFASLRWRRGKMV